MSAENEGGKTAKGAKVAKTAKAGKKTAADAAQAAEAKARREAERDAGRARKALGTGGVLSLLGLAMVGVGEADSGAVVTLLGLVMLIYGIHTFGRLGPEEDGAAAR